MVTQSKNKHELMRRFNMNVCKEISTTLEHNVKLVNHEETKEVNETLYVGIMTQVWHYNTGVVLDGSSLK